MRIYVEDGFGSATHSNNKSLFDAKAGARNSYNWNERANKYRSFQAAALYNSSEESSFKQMMRGSA